jgi:hypothetical protein
LSHSLADISESFGSFTVYDASLKQIVETHLDAHALAASPRKRCRWHCHHNDSSSSGVHESNFKAEPSDPVVPML